MGTSVAAAGAEAYQKRKAQAEAYHTDKVIISEQASGGFARDFRKFMDDVGLDAEFEKMQKQLYDHYEEIAKEQNDLYKPRKEVADKLTSLSSGPDTGSGFEDLSKIIDDLKTSKDRGLAAEGSKIEKDLKEKIEKLKKSEEFIETVKEETGKEEVTDDEIEKAASNAVFAKVKVTLADKMKKDIDTLRQDILKFLEEQFPSKDTISMLSKSKEGLKLSKLIQDTLSIYTS
jgi:membrane-associated HD superfamily phosphohydrolase